MNIHLYLENEEETQITSFYDLASNPFKVGDEISLDVEELLPVEYNKFRADYQTQLIKNNLELQLKFKRKKVKIVREGKYVKLKVGNESLLAIEYHCVYLEDKN